MLPPVINIFEKAAKKGGHNVKVPFSPGRGDASQDQTDKYSFGWS